MNPSAGPRPRGGAATDILALSLPMLVSQLAAIGTNIADTVITARHDTLDVAAVAVGGGLFMSVAIALVGVLYAAAPIVAHHVGAGRRADIAPAFQQAVWLALFLSLPGVLLLAFPSPLLSLSALDAEVDRRTRDYLLALAAALPAALLFRAFQSTLSGLGQPRPVMVIMLACLLLHVPLAWCLTTGAFGLPALGALGCGLSTLCVNWLSALCALACLLRLPSLRSLDLLGNWQAPRAWAQRELLRLGGPMGMSNFVEVTSFALIALFVARLGADVVAGHRIVGNLNGLCFMLPLALGSGTLVRVGQAAGGGDRQGARHAAFTGFTLACGLAALLAVLLWWQRHHLLALFGGSPGVLEVAEALMPYVALFVVVDAGHTLASFALRGYKVTLQPMLIHTVCFWGVGLGLGYVLAFHGMDFAAAGLRVAPMGAAGFWFATLLSTACAGVAIGALLWHTVRRSMRTGAGA